MREAQRSSAVLLEKEGRFFIYQPEIGIIASDDDIERAYKKFAGVRQEYYREMAGAGLEIPQDPEVVARRRILGSIGRELGGFLARIAIVIIVVLALSLGVALGVRTAVDRAVD